MIEPGSDIEDGFRKARGAKTMAQSKSVRKQPILPYLWYLGCLFAVLSLALLSGCGGGEEAADGSANLIGATGGRSGLIVAGLPVTLSVDVTTRSGAPVAGATVTFFAPRTGPTGAFTNPDASGPNIVSAQTNTNGTATATFTPNGQAGVYLIDAVVDGTPSAATVAITSLPALGAPALSAEQARAAIKQQLIGDHPEDETVHLHGPVLLPAGTLIVADGPNTPEFPVVPFTTAGLTWFFWLDEEPTAAFLHASRFVALNANDSTPGFAGRAHISREGWWPRITVPGGNADGVALVPALMRDGTLTRAARMAAGGSLSQITRAPDDACAIFVYGPKGGTAFKHDVDAMRDFLVNSGRVKAENCLPAKDDSLNDKPTTAGAVTAYINQAKTKGCKKLFFIAVAHGHNGGFGAAKNLSDDPPYADVQFNDLAEKLKGQPWELCLYFWSCQSGTSTSAFTGPGFNGTLVYSATLGKASYFETDKWTYYTRAFLKCWADRDANGPNKGKASMEEAHQWVLTHAGAGESNSSTFATWTLKGNPGTLTIGSHYTANPTTITLDAGTAGAVSINRSGSIVQQQSIVSLTSGNTNIAAVASPIVFPPTAAALPATIIAGIIPGTVLVDVVDSTNGLTTTFTVNVNQKVTLQKTLTASDGTMFAAGTQISTSRITGGYRISPPDTGCTGWHMHGSDDVGIFIDGKGPFPDPQPHNCGYGLVIQPKP